MIRWSWVLLAIVVSFAAGMWTMAMMADAKARDKGREDTRHCLNCDHYAYYDAPLCGLRESEGWLWEMNPKDWSCSEWELRRD